MIVDEKQRAQAIDISQSYIVQAPAGSGKTEILTQRFLKLLSVVDTPEQIIALTFTRKAANEMRERIVRALQRAARHEPPQSDHQQRTQEYANAALTRDRVMDWQLLKQPARLRIMTIDSLCQLLATAIPLQNNHVHYAQISEHPKALYLDAARACLQCATDDAAYHGALKTLFYHLDNRQDHVLSLLCDLLARRDQWLHLLYQARTQDKAVFESAIAWIEQHELSRFCQVLPLELAHNLMALVRKLVSIRDPSRFLNTDSLQNWTSLDQLDGQLATQLATILLTTQQTLRKGFDHHVGLKRGVCSDHDYDQLKKDSQCVLTQLAELPDFLNGLIRISQLPKPHYDSTQWRVLQALFSLLPLLVAHLQLLFSEQNTVDFTAIAHQALQALGDEQIPTDLALYFDNQIQHLLIDEFQDTSIQQFQLISQLVQAWEPQDGRTLFIVGDPMQSIYRFRSAEVGLFLRTQQQGIGPVSLISLELSCNFRSTATIVNWVNHQFKTIFPNHNDIESGAVSFHTSTYIKPADSTSDVKAFEFAHKGDEAVALVEHINKQLVSYPHDQIAILVRSRNQLPAIIGLLRERNIPFQGVDIDLLANLPHLRDVWSITQALLMPANRLAWLALLRSPWCGLTLIDLHCIAHVSNGQSIYHTLSKPEHIAQLSPDGRARASFIYSIFNQAFMTRHQQSLVDWIRATLQELHLDHILSAAQQEDLEQYWLLLEQFEQDGQLADLQSFQREFNALYSKKVIPARLQIMTIHKSKGLEFDCVILPGLGSKPTHRDTPLFRWLTLPTQQNNIRLLSPIKAAHEETCLLYDYLGRLDDEKNAYELQRLLYVAVTRAKKRLYLFDHHLTTRQGSFRYLLKQQSFTPPNQAILNASDEKARGSIDKSPATFSGVEIEMNDPQTLTYPKLYRLPSQFYAIGNQNPETRHRKLRSVDNSFSMQSPPTPRSLSAESMDPADKPRGVDIEVHCQQLLSSSANNQQLSSSIPKLIGIVAHRLLQWICTHHPHTPQDIPWNLAKQQLIFMGFTGDEFDSAMIQLQQQLTNLFHDPIGQWIMRAHHEEQNEYELFIHYHNALTTRIIDRTFYDQGSRWIIDFKTGHHDYLTTQDHPRQINEYASLLISSSTCPIHCGLYYLATNHWIEWVYTEDVSSPCEG